MRKILAVLLILTSIFFVGCGGGNNQPKSLADKAKEVDLMNGINTKAIGKISIVEVDSKEVTDDALKEWYENYAMKNVGDSGKNTIMLLFYIKTNHYMA